MPDLHGLVSRMLMTRFGLVREALMNKQNFWGQIGSQKAALTNDASCFASDVSDHWHDEYSLH